MKVTENKVVSLEYRLEIDGEVIDQSEAGEPLAYLHGHHNIVAGLEKALEGKEVGESFDVLVSPEEGYGIHDPENVMTLGRSDFEEEVELGMTYFAQTEDGDMMPFVVTAIEAEKVTADFNHQLAGMTLHFTGKILSVRDATEEEIESGFAHDGLISEADED